MRYSWTQFGIGVVLGAVAVSLLFVSLSYLYLSVVLLVLSAAFTIQADSSEGPPPPAAPATSDREKWRKFGRDAVHVLRSVALSVIVGLGVMVLWDFAAGRFPFLSELPREVLVPLAPVLVAAGWSWLMVAAFRSGRRRRTSPGR